MGRMTSHILWKIKIMFETTDQITIIRIVYDTQIIILYDIVYYIIIVYILLYHYKPGSIVGA